MQYDHKSIEHKWQKKWEEQKLHQAEEGSSKPKFYGLIEFPYPSGDGLHVGHPRTHVAMDIICQKRRMQGYNVLFPIGFDAFGLPAENYALKTGTHPKITTEKNIKKFTEQIKSLGVSFDWSRTFATTDPDYYKWTQWIFLKLYEKGLAYKDKMAINWCLSCKIGLANEEVVDGKCERCGGEVEKRDKEQWMLKITEYADRLANDLADLDYLQKIKTQQLNWIGRSEGANVIFKIPTNSVRLGSYNQNDTLRLGLCARGASAFGGKTQANRNERTIWFLTFSTKVREAVFSTADQAFNIMNSIFNSCIKHDFRLHEIAVMKEHVHIIVDTDQDIPVEKIYKYLKGSSAKKFHEQFEPYWENSKGTHLWTPKGNYSILDSEDKYEDALKYVRGNPEKDGLNKKERLLSENLDNLYFELEVFTTRPDTLFGATYMVLAPEHELVQQLKDQIENWPEVEKYIQKAKKKSDLDRKDEGKEKTGIEIKGVKAINPVSLGFQTQAEEAEGGVSLGFSSKGGCATGAQTQAEEIKIPIFIADYVLMGYGTGAIMAVPAHDERDWNFAKKYNLKIVEVVKPDVSLGFSSKGGCASGAQTQAEENNKKARPGLKTQLNLYEGEGININSDFLNGLKTSEAIKKITEWLEKKGLGKKDVNYKLRDWVFSRQRYWGEPIPMVHCEKCASAGSAPGGWVPVPEKDLPVLLPEVEKYEPTDTGESPLAVIEEWVNTTCPKCGGKAKRETDTMPNWAGSSWYFLRYCDPKNDKELADKKKLKYWTPIDWYNGGMEHTTLHLLYSRFWHKFLYDIKVVPTSEPYQKRTSHGMVLAEDGEKMSKSRGNVINPDEIVEKYGADTLRMYEMFMGPFSEAIAWSSNTMIGVRRFLEKVWEVFERSDIRDQRLGDDEGLTRLLHKTIKKVSEDIEGMKFNTAVSQFMILVNEATKTGASKETKETFLKLLAPFAPHLTEELWEKLGHKESIFKEKWPEYNKDLVTDETIELVVQVNGKVRDKFEVNAEISEEEAKEKALASGKVQKWIDGKEVKKVVYVIGRLISIVV